VTANGGGGGGNGGGADCGGPLLCTSYIKKEADTMASYAPVPSTEVTKPFSTKVISHFANCATIGYLVPMYREALQIPFAS